MLIPSDCTERQGRAIPGVGGVDLSQQMARGRGSHLQGVHLQPQTGTPEGKHPGLGGGVVKRQQKRLWDFPVKVELGRTLELKVLRTHLDPNTGPVQGFFQRGKGLPGFLVALGKQPYPIAFRQAGGCLEDVVGVEGFQDRHVELSLQLEAIAHRLVDVALGPGLDLIPEDAVKVLEGGRGSGRIGIRRQGLLWMAEGCQSKQQQSQQEFGAASALESKRH